MGHSSEARRVRVLRSKNRTFVEQIIASTSVRPRIVRLRGRAGAVQRERRWSCSDALQHPQQHLRCVGGGAASARARRCAGAQPPAAPANVTPSYVLCFAEQHLQDTDPDGLIEQVVLERLRRAASAERLAGLAPLNGSCSAGRSDGLDDCKDDDEPPPALDALLVRRGASVSSRGRVLRR